MQVTIAERVSFRSATKTHRTVTAQVGLQEYEEDMYHSH